VAANLHGREIWHHDFPTFPVDRRYGTGGIILWQVGHFTMDASQRRSASRTKSEAIKHGVSVTDYPFSDLKMLVTIRRSMMHGEKPASPGKTDVNFGAGPGRSASAASAVRRSPSPISMTTDWTTPARSIRAFFTSSKAPPEDIIARDTTWEVVPAKPVYWGVPAVDFAGRGRADVFFGGRSMTGLIRRGRFAGVVDALDRAHPVGLPLEL
jgi:hypothetical protein